MARAIAFAHNMPLERLQFEAARSAIVCGCAMALILAGNALPF